MEETDAKKLINDESYQVREAAFWAMKELLKK